MLLKGAVSLLLRFHILLLGSRNPDNVFNEALRCACVAVLYWSTAIYSHQGVIPGDHVTSHND